MYNTYRNSSELPTHFARSNERGEIIDVPVGVGISHDTLSQP